MRLRILFFILFPFLSYGQLQVVTDSSAINLAQAIAGSGVIVSNASVNCAGQAMGTFSYSGSNLGMTSGILLTTGSASLAPYSTSSFGDPSASYGSTFTDPDLTNISSGATNDVCILSFDFVPLCNSLSITFVFASSEYDGFVCSFNDAFGLFLTGPNPSGGNYSGLNVAVLPNGTPVSINNVNNGNSTALNCPPTNSSYFVDNLASPNQEIAYPGYTTPITSITSIVPCSTYHMKIGIADAQDWSYDSGVFIQGNSISCTNTPTVTINNTPTNCGNTGTAAVTVTGYTGTPTYQWQPGGQTTPSLSNLGAGTYTCLVGTAQSCGVITQTLVTTVASTGNAPTVSITTQAPHCANGNDGTASIALMGGSPPFTYTWSTTPVQNGANATGLSPGIYTVSYTDNGNCISQSIINIAATPSITAVVNTSPASCTGSTGSATVNVISGGAAPFSYSWISPATTGSVITGLGQGSYTAVITDSYSCAAIASGSVSVTGFSWTAFATSSPAKCYGTSTGSASVSINNGAGNTYTVNWVPAAQTGTAAVNLNPIITYTAQVNDQNGCIYTTTVGISEPPVLSATTTATKAICLGATGTAKATASGGTSPYSYSWLSTPPQVSQQANGLAQGQYTVIVSDANSCTVSVSAIVGSVNTLSLSTSSAPDRCSQQAGKVTVTPKGQPPYTYLWNDGAAQQTATAINLGAGSYQVFVTDGYSCTAPDTAGVVNTDDVLHDNFTYLPAETIEPDEEVTLLFSSNGWAVDSAFLSNGVEITSATFPYVFPVYGNYTATYYLISPNGCRDTSINEIIVKDELTVYIPNAFTPDGDGKNDVFYVYGTFIKTLSMQIYDRWGNLITTLSESKNYWDGSKSGGNAPQDIYVYRGSASDLFGKHVNFQGQITLIR